MLQEPHRLRKQEAREDHSEKESAFLRKAGNCELIHLPKLQATYLCQMCGDQQYTYLRCLETEKQKRYFSFQKKVYFGLLV